MEKTLMNPLKTVMEKYGKIGGAWKMTGTALGNCFTDLG
jgi:hypothetical protein